MAAVKMTHDFSGKVALVTGGTSGMGQGIAEGLARAGATVQIVGMPAKDPARHRAIFEEIGSRFNVFETDLTVDGEPDRAVQDATDRYGRLDMLVNAAGIFRQAPLQDSKEIFDQQWALNVRAGFHVTVAAIEHLRATRGSILFITAAAQDRAFPGAIGYVASKAAARNMVRAIAVEEAPHGVRANAIAPGEIRTALNEKLLLDEEYVHTVMASTPLGRIGEISDIVPNALHLLSDQAAYVTGACLNVDGGWDAQ